MINANELRIGNLVSHNDASMHKEIWQIGNNTVSFSIGRDRKGVEHYQTYYLEGVNPIILTEDWLLKFGFRKEDKYGNGSSYFLYTLGILTYNTSYDLLWAGNISDIKQPKYVHQLQNLYFALTGKELAYS